MNSFTYTISSTDNILGLSQANNVKIKVDNFPTQYKYFKCKVINFIINYGSFNNAWRPGSYVMLLCDNLGMQNISSNNRTAQVIAYTNLIDGVMTNNNGSFIINNLNGSTLSFSLVLQSFLYANTATIMNQNGVDTNWTLTLEITPIDDNPNNYQLRYGL
jgi:hypothetical protein